MRQMLTGAVAALIAAGAAAGHVEWSDGRLQEGLLTAGPNGTVRVHDGARVREWALERIARVVFRPESERLERAWRFVEAGQTRKEAWGEPFPVMELTADVWLADGSRVAGHLLSTVLYLETGERTEKIVIRHKLRGKGGEQPTDLVFPSELVFGEVKQNAGSDVTVRLNEAAAHGRTFDLAAMSRETMNTAAVMRDPAGGAAWRVTLEGADVVTALSEGGRIEVGWRGACDAAVRVRILQGLTDLKDFFDRRELLACATDPGDETTCHTLLLLHRHGATTLAAAASQPWRLEVWKWRLGEADDISAARRTVLFRGIRAPREPLPEIILDDRLSETADLTGQVVLKRQDDP